MIGQETPDDVSRSKMKRSNVTARYRAWPVGRVASGGTLQGRGAPSSQDGLNMDQPCCPDIRVSTQQAKYPPSTSILLDGMFKCTCFQNAHIEPLWHTQGSKNSFLALIP